MDSARHDPRALGLLTEEELKHMSRHINDLVPHAKNQEPSEYDINRLKDTFHAVFKAAENQNANASHRVAAWNTLCALIDSTGDPECPESSDERWLCGFWDRAFNLYLNNSHNARPKSSKQLLTTLGARLHTGKCHDVQERVAKRLIRGIVVEDDPSQVKACLQALAQFLRKECLLLRDVLLSLDGIKYGAENHVRSNVEDLLYVMFRVLKRGDLGSAVGQAVSAVLDKTTSKDGLNNVSAEDNRAESPRQAIWMRPLETAVDSHEIAVDDLRGHLFPTVFKRGLSEYIQFLGRHGLERLNKNSAATTSGLGEPQAQNTELLYAALQTGKELGLLYEQDASIVTQTPSSILIPVRFIGRLLSFSTPRARLTGLSLLITARTVTRPFPTSTLRLLRRHLHTFFADTDANFRSEVFSLMQQLIDRFRAVTAVLARKCNLQSSSDRNVDSLVSVTHDNHRSFLKWLLGFVSWELRPTASYQRHISALRTLSVIVRSGLDDAVPSRYYTKSAQAETKWPFHMSIMNKELWRLLLDLLLNPFDDVRQASTSILSLYSTFVTNRSLEERKMLSATLVRAEQHMLLTGRADQADGVAHLYALIYKCCGESAVSETSWSSQSDVILHLLESLERMLDIAKLNLAAAVIKYPLHGLLTSLRYVLVQNDHIPGSDGLLARIISCLHEVWNVVKPVLCNDAPEGYSPDGTEEMAGASTKDILSYCWRGLKESSLLLDSIVSTSTLDTQALLSLGNLCFTQLAELRHRGAFSTVAQTWITCCVRCVTIQSEDDKSPVLSWYLRVLEILASNTTINTRRSAGIPALICGILISDKTGELISLAFNDLSIIAGRPVNLDTLQESSLPQVHALNCIKDVLKSTRLREHSERYISLSLRLAASSLRSQAWAIRNCGLMLFRAVIDRLLGTSDAYLEDETPSTRCITVPQPLELLDVILDLLLLPQHGHGRNQSHNFEGFFPALQLLQRMNVPEDKLPVVMNRVLGLSSSKSWHIRDKAARTYAALVDGEDIEREIQRRLDGTTSNQNALHGALLCVRYLIRKLRVMCISSTSARTGIAQQSNPSSAMQYLHASVSILSSATHLYRNNDYAVTKAAYIDLLVEVYEAVYTLDSSPELFRSHNLFSAASLDISKELEHTLQVKTSASSNAVLRATLSRAFVLDICTRIDELPKDDTLTVILSLGRNDSDACCSLFRTFFSHQQCRRADSDVLSHFILIAANNVLRGDFDTKVKCEVQSLLLAFGDLYPRQNENQSLSETFVTACAAAASPFDIRSNQLYADQWLQLQAVAFERSLGLDQNDAKDSGLNVADWIKHWCTAIQERSLFSREAAALAISRSIMLWQYVSHTSSRLFCQLCFGVYDLLNDDDESIRLLASQAASQIFRHDAMEEYDESLEPIEANQKLVNVMVHLWSDDAYFIEEAFFRAFGLSNTVLLNVADQLSAFGATDDALFAEEKQNLYIDEAREVKLWSQVILIVKASSIPTMLVHRLAQWVSDGVSVLTHKAQSEADGALGWSNRPEIFTLGLQVIYGAEVLLHVVERGARLQVRPSALRLQLGQFSAAAVSRGINGLWQREIDRVLTSAIICMLQRRRTILSGIMSLAIQ